MTKGLTGFSDYQQDDGSRWRIYTPGDQVTVITTEAFESAKAKLLPLISKYRRLVTSNLEGKDRQFVAAGGNGGFYGFGDSGYGVKETRTSQSVINSLERLDKIAHLIERLAPRWINVPQHYGAVTLPEDVKRDGYPTQYLIMDKENGGITLEDLFATDNTPEVEEKIQKEFPGKDREELRIRTKEQFIETTEILRGICRAENIEFSSLFTDYHEGNIIVRNLTPPVAGKRIGFYIIDQ